MRSPEGGILSALDADSEGRRGSFMYGKSGNRCLLGSDAPLFCAYYDITEKGTGKEIISCMCRYCLQLLRPHTVSQGSAGAKLLRAVQTAAAPRRRVRPGLETIKYYWLNALMNTACSKVPLAATGDERYVSCDHNMRFLLHGLPWPAFFHYLEKKYRPHPAFRRLRVFNTGAGALAGDYG